MISSIIWGTLLVVLGHLPPRNIAPNPKTNPNSNPNPDPNHGAIFLGGNCPDILVDFFQKFRCSSNISL